MRLLLFNHEFPPVGGGGGHVTAHLAREYAARGHDVLVLTAAYKDLPRFETRDGYQIERVPCFRANPDVAQVHEMLTYSLSSTWVAMWRVRKFRPDAVQVFFGIPSGLGAWLLKKFANVPYVVFLGGRDVPRPNPDPPYYEHLYTVLKPVILEIWHSASSVVACSDGLRDLALQTAPSQAIDVIPDGIDLERFTPRLQGGTDTGPVRFLSVGRLIPRKGFDTIIYAAALLRSRAATPFEVEIVGDGPERGALESLCDELDLGKIVRFAGTVPYEALSQRYAAADAYVLTSHAEGMPLVVLEAMATGLPIIATDVQGMDELVADGENGRRFSVGAELELASHMEELLGDATQRRQMGSASVARVQKYAWTNVASSYLTLLEKAAWERASR